MRKILLGAIVAIAITIGTQETAFAATPDLATPSVRQSTVTIENVVDGDDNLSNMPEVNGDDHDND